MYVTQEVDVDMCLGICNDCYGKFPKSILRTLSVEEVRSPIHDAFCILHVCAVVLNNIHWCVLLRLVHGSIYSVSIVEH